MFLIASRLAMLLAGAYLLGLIFAWIISLFNSSDGGDWDHGSDEPDPQLPPSPGKKPQQQIAKKRLVEIDEAYYLEEFDLDKKK